METFTGIQGSMLEDRTIAKRSAVLNITKHSRVRFHISNVCRLEAKDLRIKDLQLLATGFVYGYQLNASFNLKSSNVNSITVYTNEYVVVRIENGKLQVVSHVKVGRNLPESVKNAFEARHRQLFPQCRIFNYENYFSWEGRRPFRNTLWREYSIGSLLDERVEMLVRVAEKRIKEVRRVKVANQKRQNQWMKKRSFIGRLCAAAVVATGLCLSITGGVFFLSYESPNTSDHSDRNSEDQVVVESTRGVDIKPEKGNIHEKRESQREKQDIDISHDTASTVKVNTAVSDWKDTRVGSALVLSPIPIKKDKVAYLYNDVSVDISYHTRENDVPLAEIKQLNKRQFRVTFGPEIQVKKHVIMKLQNGSVSYIEASTSDNETVLVSRAIGLTSRLDYQVTETVIEGDVSSFPVETVLNSIRF